MRAAEALAGTGLIGVGWSDGNGSYRWVTPMKEIQVNDIPIVKMAPLPGSGPAASVRSAPAHERAEALPLMTICVLTFNRRDLVRKLLEQLTTLDYAPLELIVVDNHSEDGTDAMLRTEFPALRHLRTERNLGAAGRNVGMQAARGVVVVTLDDDVHGLHADDLRELARLFAGDPDIGAINFRVTNENGQVCNWVHHCRVEDFEHCLFRTYEITEGAVAFRRSALERAGYYADAFFLSHEGPDLAFRILEHGYEVIYTGAITVQHGFAEAGRQPWRNYYYDTRNQLWLAARNFPPAYAARYLARGLLSTLVYSLRDGYFRYWLEAIADGLAGLRGQLAQRRVLSARTMERISYIDAQRPGIGYLIRKRLFTRDGLLLR